MAKREADPGLHTAGGGRKSLGNEARSGSSAESLVDRQGTCEDG